MDPSIDQSSASADPGSKTTPIPAPTPEEKKQMASGDIPMRVDDSIKAAQAQESETMNKMNEIANATQLNDSNAMKAAEKVDDKKEQPTATSKPPTATPDKTNSEGQVGSSSVAASSSDPNKKDQIKELYEKIDKSTAPDELKGICKDRISRLDLIKKSSGGLSSTFVIEYEQTSRYINWVVDIPWNNESEDRLDLAKAKQVMDESHYGLEPLKDRVLQFIASLMMNIKNNKGRDNVIKAPILCMLGLAGTGKTTFAKTLADALGRSFQRIPFGGMADSRVLRGQSRYFPDAEPGAVVKCMIQAKTKNPVILIDEIDRVTDSARADIMGVLIEVLDPEQNAHFTDHYIDYPTSLQNVIFVATANNVAGVATAVLDRLEIIRMPSYNDDEKIYIGKNFILPKAMKLTGLLPEQLIIDEDVWEPLVRPLGYDPGVRGLDRLVTNMCRKAAMLIISGEAGTVRITNDNVKNFMPQW